MDSHNQDGAMAEGFIFPSEAQPVLSWPPLPPPHYPFTTTTNAIIGDHGRFLPPLPPHHHLHPFYSDLYARRASSSALPFAYDGGAPSDPVGLAGLYIGGGMGSPSPFGALQAELGRMSTQEIMDAKALAASKSHSEAERRRRQRISAHFAKLRSLLPSTTKTDKASLLAEVIQHVKELKRQTSEIAEESPLPTELDELTVDATSDEDGRLVVRASLCCDDRSDLLPDLIKTLKSLHLRALKADITTLGGRVKNVLVITADGDDEPSVATIQDALRAVMDRSAVDEPSPAAGGSKRQRTTGLSTILEHRSI